MAGLKRREPVVPSRIRSCRRQNTSNISIELDDDEPVGDIQHRMSSASLSDSERETEPETKKRRSGRMVRVPEEIYDTSSTSSTPRKKRKMKMMREKNVKKPMNTNRQVCKMVKLNVDGRALPGREAAFNELNLKLSFALKAQQGLCLCTLIQLIV